MENCIDVIRITTHEKSLDAWYQQLIALIGSVETQTKIVVSNCGYKKYPELFVTDGLKAVLKERNFEIWSDVPGEVLIKHSGIKANILEEIKQSFIEA